MSTVTEKACVRCKEVKNIERFALDNRIKSGRKGHCKDCENKWKRQYEAKMGNKEDFVSHYNKNKLVKGGYINMLLRHANYRAKKKGLEFSLRYEDIQLPERCPVFPWLKLERSTGRPHDSSPSLDRMDNSKGYVKGNVQIISYRANTLKSSATPEELEKLLEYVRGRSTLSRNYIYAMLFLVGVAIGLVI